MLFSPEILFIGHQTRLLGPLPGKQKKSFLHTQAGKQSRPLCSCPAILVLWRKTRNCGAPKDRGYSETKGNDDCLKESRGTNARASERTGQVNCLFSSSSSRERRKRQRGRTRKKKTPAPPNASSIALLYVV